MNGKIIKTSSADETLNKNQRAYQKTVIPSLDRLEKEIIPQWRKTLSKLDQHDLEMLGLKTEITKLKRLCYENHRRILSLEQPEKMSRTIFDIGAEGKIIALYKMTDKPLYYVDIAEALGLPLKQIVRIVEDLEERGIIEEVNE